MRVQRSALVTGVGAGNRKVEVKVSYSPHEFALVEAEAARQGWTVGGWVGAMTEYIERLAAPPEGGGLEAVGWGRIAERAGSIEAAARSLTGTGAPSSPVDIELAARRVRRLCSARAVAVRDEAAQANARAAEFAELLVVQMDESFRAAGGLSRRRVRVLLSEPTAAVLRSGAPPHTGLTVSQWVGCLAAAASGWLAAGPDNRSPLEQWFQRLSAVRTMLLTTLEQGDALDAVASWAGAELAVAERALGELAGESRASRRRASTEEVLDLLGWQPGQMRLRFVLPRRHDGRAVTERGAESKVAEWSEIEKLLGRLLEDLPAAGTYRPRPLTSPWPREDLPGRPGEPVLHVFRPPPGRRLTIDG